jgi:hypothetical protein
MNFITQAKANILFAIISTWVGLLALNVLPDNHVTHWITVAMSGLQLFLVNMGFQRTPQGNKIPDVVKNFVDNNTGTTIREAQIVTESK